MTRLTESLRRFIDETFLFGVNTDYADDASLMDNSIIDSTGVLELIAYLEAEYGISIADEDLVPENLDSIDGLVAFIDRKRTVGEPA